MLYGGVSVTVSHAREVLGSQTKVIHNLMFAKVPTSHGTAAALPTFRVEMSNPFAVTGVDFIGPICCRVKKSITVKACIALFTCNWTHLAHLKLSLDLSSPEFQTALKGFIARRGYPQILANDNGKTFKATGKWLSTVKEDHNHANYVGALNVRWEFNLAQAL